MLIHSLPILSAVIVWAILSQTVLQLRCCTVQLPALTQDWTQSIHDRKEEIRKLAEFYRLSLALQKYRRKFESTVPTSIHPDEPHPQQQASITA